MPGKRPVWLEANARQIQGHVLTYNILQSECCLLRPDPNPTFAAKDGLKQV